MSTTPQVKVTEQRLGRHAVLVIMPDHPEPQYRYVVLDSLKAAQEWLPGYLARHGGDAYVVPLKAMFRGGEPQPQELFPVDD